MKRLVATWLACAVLLSAAIEPARAQSTGEARAALFYKRPVVVGGGGGTSVTINSFTYSLDTSFTAGATTQGIGTTYASAACPTFTAGQVIFAMEVVNSDGGGDPGAGSPLSTPSTFTSLDDGSHGTFLAGDNRVGLFYKTAAGGETCPFTSNWTTSSQYISWTLLVLTYTGTPPGSVLDAWHCEAHAPQGDSSMPAASISPASTNALLVGLYTSRSGFGPYTLNAALTSIVNTEGVNGFRSMSMSGQQTLSSSGATGAKNSAMTNSSKNEVNCLIAFNP